MCSPIEKWMPLFYSILSNILLIFFKFRIIWASEGKLQEFIHFFFFFFLQIWECEFSWGHLGFTKCCHHTFEDHFTTVGILTEMFSLTPPFPSRYIAAGSWHSPALSLILLLLTLSKPKSARWEYGNKAGGKGGQGGRGYFDWQGKSRAFFTLPGTLLGHKVLFLKLEVWGRSAAFSTWP